MSKITEIIKVQMTQNITVHKLIKLTILINLSLSKTNIFGALDIKIWLNRIKNHKLKIVVKLKII